MNPLVPRDAEQSVLGACLKFPECLDTARGILPGPAAFGSSKHRTIYEAMLRIADTNRRADTTSVIEELRSSGELAQIGGRVYLVELIEDTVTSAQLAQHCEIVREAFRLRSFEQIADRLKAAVRTPGIESAAVMEELERALTDLDSVHTDETICLQAGAVEYIDDLLSGKPAVPEGEVIKTRISGLNRFLGGGLFKGDMVVVAGPPSMGKSSFALDLCIFAATMQHSSLYHAPDETVQAVKERVIIAESGLTRDKLIAADFEAEEKRDLQIAKDRIRYAPGKTFVVGSTNLTAADVAAAARRLHRRQPLSIVVVDYLTLVRPPRHMRSGRYTATQIVGENSHTFKALAKDLNVLVVVVSQLSREYARAPFNPEKGEHGIPTQDMLRDSGDIEADANVILFPWRPIEAIRKRGFGPDHKWYQAAKGNNPDGIEDATIVVAKQKVGKTGRVAVKWNGTRMQYYSPWEGPEAA